MIAKHSNEQSSSGEGVEVITNEPHEDEKHGKGQFTEKRIHLSSRLPQWIRSLIPRIFYITEKAWNYYPHTITEYTCSFVPKFVINIQTSYEDNAGNSHNALNLTEEQLSTREVDVIDITYDEISPKHYKIEEDLKQWKSAKTKRGPLDPDWIKNPNVRPIMCSYKYVSVSFEVWGLQTRVEDYVQRVIREVLLVGHRQAVAWLDQWIDMTEADVRHFEKETFAVTNEKVRTADGAPADSEAPASPVLDGEVSPKQRGWFSWS